MWRYIGRKLLMSVPILLGVLTAVFLFVRLVPGDPAQAILGEYATEESLANLREQLGLTRPPLEQYFTFMGNALQGEFGRSLQTKQPVMARIIDALPATLQLAAGSIVVAVLVGVPLGVVAAVKRNRMPDYIATVVSLLGVSMPNFWFGILLLILFAVKLDWFPLTGAGTSGNILETLKFLVLPSLTLGIAEAGLIARMTRSSMLEILDQDFIRTARAKGLRARTIVYRHALRNALIPVVTIVGLNMGRLLGGTVIVETLFVRPGLGQIVVSSMVNRDYPQVQGTVAFFAVAIIAVNVLIDVAYGMLDPRIRFE